MVGQILWCAGVAAALQILWRADHDAVHTGLHTPCDQVGITDETDNTCVFCRSAGKTAGPVTEPTRCFPKLANTGFQDNTRQSILDFLS